MSYRNPGENWIFGGQKLTFVLNLWLPKRAKKAGFFKKSRECEFSWPNPRGSGAIFSKVRCPMSLKAICLKKIELRQVIVASIHTWILAALRVSAELRECAKTMTWPCNLQKCSDEAQTSLVGSQISQAFARFLFSEAQSQYFPVKIRFFMFNGWISGCRRRRHAKNH